MTRTALKHLRVLLLVVFVALLSSCDGFFACSYYNDDRDDFRMSFVDSAISIPLGETRTVQLNRSWLDDDLRREQLSCDVNKWEYEPDGIAEFEEGTLEITALAVGTTTARAIVTGGGGTKTAELFVTVIAN